MKLELRISGIGPPPSFKNSKKIVRNRKTGRLRLITKPEYAAWMKEATRAFESQLSSAFRTTGAATSTAPWPPSSIVSLAPLDDSRQWIPEIHVRVEIVPKGAEGAILLLESL